jgi:diguanylate cyclase (GGDEF)-like protein
MPADLTPVIDRLPFGVLLLDERAAAGFANQAWVDLSGQVDQGWAGHRWFAVLDLPERGPFRQQLVSAMASQQRHETELMVDHASVGRRILHAQLTPTGDSEPDPAGILTVLDVTEEHRRVDQLIELATHDPLTGLVNRHQFVEFLDHALERIRRQPDSVTGVYFVDVDRFKLVNDTYGHQTGDALLRAVGEHLVAEVRPMDVVARFGGDEFVLLCEDLRSPEVAEVIATRLRRIRIEIPGTTGHCRLSVGWTLAEATAVDSASVINRADDEMYREKHRDRL